MLENKYFPQFEDAYDLVQYFRHNYSRIFASHKACTMLRGLAEDMLSRVECPAESLLLKQTISRLEPEIKNKEKAPPHLPRYFPVEGIDISVPPEYTRDVMHLVIRQLICDALIRCGTINSTAKYLGVSERTIRNYLSKYRREKAWMQ